MKKVRPFIRLTVNVANVAYDFDDSDLTDEQIEIMERDGNPPASGTIEYTADELFCNWVLKEKDGEWMLDEEALREFVEDKIVRDTDFFVRDFDMAYEII